MQVAAVFCWASAPFSLCLLSCACAVSFSPVPVTELTVQNFLPLVGIAVAAVVLHMPVDAILSAALRWAGFAQFDVQHPGLADEIRRREALEAKANELSAPELRAVVSQLLRVRVHAARAAVASGAPRSAADRLERVVAPGFCERLHWKTLLAHALIFGYLVYSLIFITFFCVRRYATRDASDVSPPRGATLLADLFIAWIISMAIYQVALQPALFACRIVWEYVLFPDVAAWAMRDEWFFDPLTAISPVPPFALRNSTLGARFAVVSVVEAAGAASGLSREHAMVAYGVAPCANGTVMRVVEDMRRGTTDEPPAPDAELAWRDLLLQLYLISLVVKAGDVDAIEPSREGSSGAGPRVVPRVNFGAGSELRAAAARHAAQMRTTARTDDDGPLRRAPSQMAPPLGGRRATADEGTSRLPVPAAGPRTMPGSYVGAAYAADFDGLAPAEATPSGGQRFTAAASGSRLTGASAASLARTASGVSSHAGGGGGGGGTRYSLAARGSSGGEERRAPTGTSTGSAAGRYPRAAGAGPASGRAPPPMTMMMTTMQRHASDRAPQATSAGSRSAASRSQGGGYAEEERWRAATGSASSASS